MKFEKIMINNYKIFLFFAFLSATLYSNAATLSKDAQNRGINQTCFKYLTQIENSYKLNGLNITFAHPESPAKFPSLHISSQKYNNGSSSFSATLTPNGEYCFLSTILVTSVNNQSCSEIRDIKVDGDTLLDSTEYADGDYIILTPIDKTYQIILTSSGENSCSMTEARMMWPGR
jgi:hypothetical protein